MASVPPGKSVSARGSYPSNWFTFPDGLRAYAQITWIDDWSWRKAQTDGTIIIDFERGTVVDVFDDREVVTCTAWLRRHPEVEVKSRDRCGFYAQALPRLVF